MNRRSPRVSWLVISVAILLLGGCGDPTKGIISGTVLVDGQPAETGAISYTPLDGRSPTAGTVIKEGKYKATVPVGSVRVEIRIPKVVGEVKIYDTPDSPIQKVMEESLPAKYNDESELTYEVPSGASTKDYDFKTE